MKNIWIKDIPFKISFFQWRVWRKKVASNDNLKRMRICLASKYYCYERGEERSKKHLFLTNPIATRLWKEFASCVSIIMEESPLQYLITKWWTIDKAGRLQPIPKGVPLIIMWLFLEEKQLQKTWERGVLWHYSLPMSPTLILCDKG